MITTPADRRLFAIRRPDHVPHSITIDCNVSAAVTVEVHGGSFLLNLTTVKSWLVESAATTLRLGSSATEVARAVKKGEVVESLMTWRQSSARSLR